MSMNFMLGYVPNTDIAALGAVSEQRVGIDEASSLGAENASAAQVGEHLLLVTPNYDLEESLPLLADPPEGTVLVTMAGVSDVYALKVFGTSTRHRMETAGEITIDEGAPLGVESELAEHRFPEDSHRAIFHALSGVTEEELWEAEWAEILPAWGSAPDDAGPAPTKGGYLKRLFGK